MKLNKYELLRKGIYVDQIKHLGEISQLIKRLYPISSEHQLIRFGSPYDGGYLVPDDLEGITTCFSPGVDVNASFEIDILNKKGIVSHLADFSVEGPPASFKPASFTKKYLGCVDDEKFITLDSWVRNQTSLNSQEDLLLQMDIEGGEYLSLLGVSEDVLKKFRIIVVEIHHIEAWAQKVFFEIVETFFEKLLKHFYVLHNHPNNYPGIVNIGGIEAPRIFELTLIRKDRVNQIDYSNEFPHPLDSPNVTYKPNIVLPKNWFLSKDTSQTRHKKYLLCRPRGGLNDVLSQIEKCWRYSENFNRTLIIDTRDSEAFKNNFNVFFEVNNHHSAIIELSDKTINLLNRMETFPAIIQNQLDNYLFEWDEGLKATVKKGTNEVLSFNFNKNYEESLLVHDDFGGLEISMHCLKRLKLSSNFGKIVLSRLNSNSYTSYIAIHIRHTDHQTEYKKMFAEIYPDTIGKNLLVCTDNHEVFIEAQKFFGESEVFNLGEMTDTKGEPPHLFKTTQAEKYKIMAEAMADLIALSQAKKLFILELKENGILKLKENGIHGRYSGFSLLAKNLSDNPSVISNLLQFNKKSS